MSIRTDRVAKLIQREVADLLRTDFHEASQSLVTVTGARMTKDLGIAYVDVSVLGDKPEQRQAAFKRLEALTPQVRTALAARIRNQFKRVPELRFFLDDSPQRAQRMEDIFAQIRTERAEREGTAADADGDGEEEYDGPGAY